MKRLLLATTCLLTTICHAQISGSSERSAYLLFGIHPKPVFHITSGSSTLISDVHFAYEMGFNWGYSLGKRTSIRSNYAVHLNMGNIVLGINDSKKSLPSYNNFQAMLPRVLNNADIGATFLLGYELIHHTSAKLTLFTGPALKIYTNAADVEATEDWYSDTTGIVTMYQYDSDYRHDPTTTFRLSLPQLEWSFLLEYQHSFKKLGTLGFGLKYHIGTKRLERSTYVTYPSMPAITSTGTFSYNRNYCGIYASYFFGSKKKGK